MEIHLAKSSGFCLGVKRALQIAFCATQAQKNVCMLGDIVHNEDVVRQIKEAGIKKIDRLTKGKNKTLLIRAHGAPIKTFAQAEKLGYQIIDATCPMVKEIHKIAKDMEQRSFRIMVIGDKRHDEVQGIVGQLKNKAIVVDCPKRIPTKALKGAKKVAVVVQSTQNMEKVRAIVKVLKHRIKRLKFYNTICKPTRNKQNEIRKMARQNDTVIIIGSKTSANTRRLYEIAKSLNKRSSWVQAKEDLKAEWFKGINTVGVVSGASTPDSTTQGVINQIRSYS